MNLSVVAAYDNFYVANGAVRELIDYGFPREHIRIYTRENIDATGLELGEYMEIVEEGALVQSARLPGAHTVGAQVGAGVGASMGITAGLLSLFGLLQIHGLDGLATLVAAITTGTLGGAALGEILGSLIGFGIPLEESERYAESLRQSEVVVKIHAEPYTTRLVQDVLTRYRPHRLDQSPAEPEEGKLAAFAAFAQRLQPATARIFRR